MWLQGYAFKIIAILACVEFVLWSCGAFRFDSIKSTLVHVRASRRNNESSKSYSLPVCWKYAWNNISWQSRQISYNSTTKCSPTYRLHAPLLSVQRWIPVCPSYTFYDVSISLCLCDFRLYCLYIYRVNWRDVPCYGMSDISWTLMMNYVFDIYVYNLRTMVWFHG